MKNVAEKYYVLWSKKLSRIAKQPVEIPNDVEINIKENIILFKGPKGELSMTISNDVNVNKDDKKINVEMKDDNSAIAGTTRSLIYNNVIGVTKGYEKKLNLVGVGYRAEVKNKSLH